MTISRRDAMLATAALLPAGLILTPAFGQVRVEGGGVRGAAPAVALGEDPLLAACFLMKGRRQIETCTFAKGLTKNEDVKAFLAAEIDEHEKLKADLEKLGFAYPTAARAGAVPGRENSTPPKGTTGNERPSGGLADPATPADSTRAPGRTDGVAAPQLTVAIGSASVASPAANLLAFDAEVTEQCIANYKAMIQKKQGLKLEKAIVGDQKHTHVTLLDNTMVALRHGSEKMQPSLKEALATIQKHLATLEALMEKLDGMQDKG